jgi:hypothetical protein
MCVSCWMGNLLAVGALAAIWLASAGTGWWAQRSAR